ncbi:protein kinase [Halorubrum sp. BOL3-1]|uniref:protein kinase n=1 Tax=Halorubrum sp. BOL3-1 TaxID=2497325 RepID=UPI00140CE825
MDLAEGETALSRRYAAPEQHDSFSEPSHQTDVYQLGVTLYELLTGEYPFGEGPNEMVQDKIEERYPAGEPEPGLTERADDVFSSLLAPIARTEPKPQSVSSGN